jgi:hypothetical protein
LYEFEGGRGSCPIDGYSRHACVRNQGDTAEALTMKMV